MHIPVALVCLGLLSNAPTREIDDAAAASDLHATPRLVAERPVVMPGETIWLAIDFTIDDGWHTYWPGINDTGFALDTTIEASRNVDVGDPVWAAPHRTISTGDILDHTFDEHMTVLLPVTVSPEARLGDQITLKINGRWLVCQSACVLESADLAITIPVSDALSKPSREVSALFERARARLPEPVTDETPAKIELAGNTLRITSNIARRLAFYPWDDSRRPRDLLTQGASETGTLVIDFRDSDKPVRGVLEIWTSDDESKVYAIEIPEPTAHTPTGSSESTDTTRP